MCLVKRGQRAGEGERQGALLSSPHPPADGIVSLPPPPPRAFKGKSREGLDHSLFTSRATVLNTHPAPLVRDLSPFYLLLYVETDPEDRHLSYLNLYLRMA